MGFPDRIERVVEIAHPPAKVWAALTTAGGLGSWFGNQATIDLRPGGPAQMTWTDGHTVDMRVEEPTVFGFTWHIYGLPDDDPRCTYVEFTLEPVGAGTRLTVVETGFAQLPEDAYHKEYEAGLRRLGRPEPARHPGHIGVGRARYGHGPGRSTADHAAGDRRHLALLAEAGLVTAEPGERRRVRYRLHSTPMQVAQQFLAALARDWDGPLDALKDHLSR